MEKHLVMYLTRKSIMLLRKYLLVTESQVSKCGFHIVKKKGYNIMNFLKFFIFITSIYLGRFLGSAEGTAIMTTVNLLLLAMLILLLCFLFRRYFFRLKRKYGFWLVFLIYISILFCISLFCYCLRIYFLSFFLESALPFLIFGAFFF
jgi:hypothetical protein